jgi:hypothetical protein
MSAAASAVFVSIMLAMAMLLSTAARRGARQ